MAVPAGRAAAANTRRNRGVTARPVTGGWDPAMPARAGSARVRARVPITGGTWACRIIRTGRCRARRSRRSPGSGAARVRRRAVRSGRASGPVEQVRGIGLRSPVPAGGAAPLRPEGPQPAGQGRPALAGRRSDARRVPVQARGAATLRAPLSRPRHGTVGHGRPIRASCGLDPAIRVRERRPTGRASAGRARMRRRATGLTGARNTVSTAPRTVGPTRAEYGRVRARVARPGREPCRRPGIGPGRHPAIASSPGERRSTRCAGPRPVRIGRGRWRPGGRPVRSRRPLADPRPQPGPWRPGIVRLRPLLPSSRGCRRPLTRS